jgi:16S rRNA (cytosine967-C5)-methyltransferase
MIAQARSTAFEILLQVASTDAHSDELLYSSGVDALSAQDRGLATTLVLGTLRWQLSLDAEIFRLLTRPGARLSPVVETALRLGAFQLLHLDRIPPHAAIGESVELTKQAGETHASGMVNAVLRRLARLPRPPADAIAAHPAWLVERWTRAHGPTITRGICEYDQEPATPCVRLAHQDAERSLLEDGIEFTPGEFLKTARRVVSGDVLRSRAYVQGWLRIQDEGSQLIAELAGHGSRILDTCAAPGGKTAILAERNPQAQITAVDVSRRRLEAMQRNFRDPHVQFAVCDAATMDFEAVHDLILCDVPCSGTGTIGRNPEIRLRITEAEIARQHQRQVKILARALDGLSANGRLLYSTCSLEPEENEAVVEECLADRPQFRAVPIEPEIDRLGREGFLHAAGAEKLRSTALRGGFLCTIPGVHTCDGFFAALLVRANAE